VEISRLQRKEKYFKNTKTTAIRHSATLVPEVYFSSPSRNENNKNKPLEPGYHSAKKWKIIGNYFCSF
jgi:hypothetical protein